MTDPIVFSLVKDATDQDRSVIEHVVQVQRSYDFIYVRLSTYPYLIRINLKREEFYLIDTSKRPPWANDL